ncbi:unnamed protein product [Penicillium nalgiovense]|nr:unnamed protein product [Penicillium nalgiovense]
MSSFPPEQVNNQYKDMSSMFNQQNPDSAGSSKPAGDDSKAPLPKGVVLDKDGKPYLPHLHLRRLMASIDQASRPQKCKLNLYLEHKQNDNPNGRPRRCRNPSPSETPSDCPPDVEELGRSTWTLLHSMAATYPEKADAEHQANMGGFLKFFSKLYPCWVCADDFRAWMAHPSGRNQPKLGSRKEFGWWMCEAHNEVNRKLGKKEFDCRLWEERWRTGWKDGRCD